jgi:Transglycosylase-like domain
VPITTRKLVTASAVALALGIVSQPSGSVAVTPAQGDDAGKPSLARIHVLDKPTEHFTESLRLAHRKAERRAAKRAKAARSSGDQSGATGFPTPESVGVSSATLDTIAACESGGDPTAVSPDGTYHGLYQFDYGTWASVGGSGDPAAASAEEQSYRAALLYAQSGSSPWPICGA